MKRFLSILFFMGLVMTVQSQSFCLRLTEVSNDGTDYVVKVEMQSDSEFNLGSSNLQFSYNNAALGTPTLLASPLPPPPSYFVPTVTTPLPGEASLNIELGFPGFGTAILASPDYTELATISFPIVDASNIGAFSWSYNGGTTESVSFLDDEATQIFATSVDCLLGIEAAVTGPENDLCSGALTIECGGTASGTTAEATAEADIAGCTTAVNTAPGVWYAIVGTGLEITVNTNGSLYDTKMGVYSGACDDLTCVGTDDDGGDGLQSQVSFISDAGATYFVYITGFSTNSGDYTLNATCLTAQEGCTDATACNYNNEAGFDDGSCVFAEGCDTCSGEQDGTGIVIDNPEVGETCDDGNPDTTGDVIGANCTCSGIAGNQVCASAEAIGEGTFVSAAPNAGGGASNVCFTGATNAVWYAYTPSISGDATISSCLGGQDTRVSVYTSCEATECYASNDDSCPFAPDGTGNAYASELTMPVIAGETYLIEWDDRWSDASFDFSISIESVVEVLGCIDENACNYDELANTDDGSCILAEGCDVCDGEGGVIDNEEIGDLCDDGDVNTENDMFVDCGVCEGTPIVVAFGCTDVEACNYDETANTDDESCLFILDACDDGDAATANDTVNEDCICEGTAIASNATCSDALPIGEGLFTASAPIGGEGASNICFDGATNAVWYAYTATFTGDALVSSCMGGADTRVSVYTSCDATECYAGDDDTCPFAPDGTGSSFASELTMSVTEGETYLIEWDDRWSNSGFEFSISDVTPDEVLGCTNADACNYDELANTDDGSCILAEGCDVCDGEGGVIDNDEIGDLCDDGDADTENDIFVECGVCQGTPIEPVLGCTDAEACNFNELANSDDGSCLIIGAACDDGNEETLLDEVSEECVCIGTEIPSNATCDQALAIGEGTFASAAPLGGEGASNICFTNATNAVWYAYTASFTGDALVSSCLGGADTRVSVYTSCDATECYAANDDACPFAPDGSGTSWASELTMSVTAGETYLIEWDDRWGAEEFIFSISNVTPSEVLGCTDEDACNYDELANTDDGTCIVPEGCDECDGEGGLLDNPEVGDACDDGLANTENDVFVACGVCEGTPVVDVFGCTDGEACNFDATATVDDGSCTYGLIYIPVDFDASDVEPAVQACEAPEGYVLGDQNCLIELILEDPFCIETDWDILCEEAYLSCVGTDDCLDIESSMWGEGPWLSGSTQYTFVAENANDAILAQGEGDVMIEVFEGACGGNSLGIFNNYDAGQIERAVPGNLIAGNTYSYFVTTEGDAGSVMSKVKKYAATYIEDEYCNSTMELIDQIYCSREEDMYANPAVNVVGFAFKFVHQVTGEEIVLTDLTADGFYQQLTTIAGFELGATYDVSAAHQVIQNANGTIQSLFSDYGPSCPITIETQVPLTNVRDEYCGGGTTFALDDMIKAYGVTGATQYEWLFDNGIDQITHQSPGYPLYLWQVPGLEYGQAYTITVRAYLNGQWGTFGSSCTILMDSQPSATKVRDTHCGLDYAVPSTDLLFADIVFGATQYTWEFNDGSSIQEFTSSNYKLFMASTGLSTGTYNVRVKAFAGGVQGDYAFACPISINGGGPGLIEDNNDLANKSFEPSLEATIYPNPNSGDNVSLNLTNLSDDSKKVVIEVMDLFGKKVYSEQVASTGSTFMYELRFAQNLPTGLYLVQVQVNGETITEKLVVE